MTAGPLQEECTNNNRITGVKKSLIASIPSIDIKLDKVESPLDPVKVERLGNI
jgi:hypothetical protein